MLDFPATLSPANGLVDDVRILRPNGQAAPLWTVACNINLHDQSCVDINDLDYEVGLVGACGFDRVETYVRAAGEAVERAALSPTSAHDETPPPNAALFVHPFDCTITTKPPSGHHWQPATDMTTAETVWLPKGLVEYPLIDSQSVDDSPSGTAAGPEIEHAEIAALLEIIERDTAMVIWHERLAVPRLSNELLLAAPGPIGSSTRTVLDALEPGSTLAVGQIPSAVPGVVTAIAFIVERGPGWQIGAVGSKSGFEYDAVFSGAIREALQVRGLERSVALRETECDTAQQDWSASERRMTTVDRTRVWTTRAAVDELDAWIAHWPFAEHTQCDRVEPPDRLHALISGIRTDGGRPIVIDMSDRLPATIRTIGWHVVKVVCPGLQRLIMDETRPGVLNEQRLSSATQRLGLGRTPGPDLPPHPWV